MGFFRKGNKRAAVLLALVVMAVLAPPAVRAQALDPASPPGGLTAIYAGGERAGVAPASSALFTPVVSANPAPSAAAPLYGPYASGDDRSRALDCMSLAIAYEAAGQPIAGQQAVGQVILNRVRDPHRPKTVCGVVFQGSERRTGCQFTFACDGSLHRRVSTETLLTARSVAAAVLAGVAPDHVGGATNYHADYVTPLWAATGRRVAQIGAHIFYAMPGVTAHGVSPVVTVDEPDMTAAVPAPVARSSRHAGRRVVKPSPMITPVASHSMFQPWGLAVAGQQ